MATVMGLSAQNDEKKTKTKTKTKTKETMVSIRVSDKSNNNHSISLPSTPTTPLDHENPNKKIKLVQQQSPNCDDDNDTNIEQREDDEDEDGDEDEGVDDAEPIGDVIRVSDASGYKRNHFRSFLFDGYAYHLEDTVLVTPEKGKVKPSVAIIKDIFQAKSGRLMVCGRRFYRPEEAEKEEGGTWETRDARELFYSSCLDEVYTCNVMHKCIIHLVPLGKTLPDRKEQPGFIVQKFYDFKTKKIRNLTETDCAGILLQSGATETS